MKALNLADIRRILVLQLRQIGDVLLATPSLELLQRRFPQAQIDVVTEIKCAPMLENNPNVHAIRRLDKSRMKTLFGEIPWYWGVARDDYDMLIDFQQLPRCRWIAAFSNAPIRLTHTPGWWKRPLYTHYVERLDGYAAASKASILRVLGIEWNGEQPRLYLHKEELDDAARHLRETALRPGNRLITVDVTHKDRARRWPAAYYAELLERLAVAESDLRFLFIYGPGEKEQVDAVRARYNGPGKASDLFLTVPPTASPRMAAAYISYASMHLGNCSAPRHMATALDVPTFTILGGSSPEWTSPLAMHKDVDVPPGESFENASEPQRSRAVRMVADAFLEHLRCHGRRCWE